MPKTTPQNLTFQDYEGGSVRKELNDFLEKYNKNAPQIPSMTASHLMRVAILEGLKVLRKANGYK